MKGHLFGGGYVDERVMAVRNVEGMTAVNGQVADVLVHMFDLVEHGIDLLWSAVHIAAGHGLTLPGRPMKTLEQIFGRPGLLILGVQLILSGAVIITHHAGLW